MGRGAADDPSVVLFDLSGELEHFPNICFG